MKDVIVRFVPLPVHVRAFTIPDAQGDYNVYINEQMTGEQQKRSLAHEKHHIDNDDFSKNRTATEIERLIIDNIV